MPTMEITGNGRTNRLLAALPTAERSQLMQLMEHVWQEIKQVVYEPNADIPYVYFPISSVNSLIIVMEDGKAVEVGTIGNEGMVGLPVFLGAAMTPGTALCQIAGEALRLPTEQFKREVIEQESALFRLLHRYTQAIFVQAAQGLACNRLHSLEQRFCRWMLTTHDRVGNDTFLLTQEFIAQMLGVRRASVSGVASAIQKAGLLTYHRGRITILDRPRMEQASCECYQVIRAEYDQVFA